MSGRQPSSAYVCDVVQCSDVVQCMRCMRCGAVHAMWCSSCDVGVPPLQSPSCWVGRCGAVQPLPSLACSTQPLFACVVHALCDVPPGECVARPHLVHVASRLQKQLLAEMESKAAEASCKSQFVLMLLEELADKGHRTLVFSQSRVMLDILQVWVWVRHTRGLGGACRHACPAKGGPLQGQGQVHPCE